MAATSDPARGRRGRWASAVRGGLATGLVGIVYLSGASLIFFLARTTWSRHGPGRDLLTLVVDLSVLGGATALAGLLLIGQSVANMWLRADQRSPRRRPRSGARGVAVGCLVASSALTAAAVLAVIYQATSQQNVILGVVTVLVTVLPLWLSVLTYRTVTDTMRHGQVAAGTDQAP